MLKKLLQKIKKKAIDDIEQNLSVIICDNTRTHKYIFNGKLKDEKLREAAHCFWTDVDMQEKFHVSMSDLVRNYGKQEGVAK